MRIWARLVFSRLLSVALVVGAFASCRHEVSPAVDGGDARRADLVVADHSLDQTAGDLDGASRDLEAGGRDLEAGGRDLEAGGRDLEAGGDAAAGAREAGAPDLGSDAYQGPTCTDGTPYGRCSKTRPHLCTRRGQLDKAACAKCGCLGLLTCATPTGLCEPTTITLPATADAYSHEWNRTSALGSDDKRALKIGRYGKSTGQFETYLGFDLGKVPAAATIVKATLKLHFSSWSGAGSVPADILLIADPWDEWTVTYAKRPATLPTPTVSIPLNLSTTQITVTALVDAWQRSKVVLHGLCLRRAKDRVKDLVITADSKDASVPAIRKPRLVVEYK